MSLFTKLRSSKKNAKKDQAASEIGIPFSVTHNIHVGYNQHTGEIEGLPQPWLRLLQTANIRYVINMHKMNHNFIYKLIYLNFLLLVQGD